MSDETKEQEKPIAWMRKWALDGENPYKVGGKWPCKFKYYPVKMNQVFKDDVPLMAIKEK